MTLYKKMEAALIADGEKLRALTGDDHGPWDYVSPRCPKCGATSGDDWRQCGPHYPCPMGGHGAPLPDIDGPHYLIIKRGLYERPDHQGYTGIRDQAGRYLLSEAKNMARLSAGECSWVHEDQEKEFMPEAWHDLVITHLQGQRDALTTEVAELREQLATARAALERIERWHGEFPPTGRFWKNEDGSPSDRPMSYGACLGSNGERDYMRAIARAALP